MKKYLAILIFTFCITSLNAQTYEEYVNRAMDYTEQGEYAAAEQAFLAALRKEPGNAGNTMLMVNLGTVQRHLGKFDEALFSYNVAIDKYTDIAFLRHNRAALYCEMDRFDDAMKDYNAILLSNPDDIEALYRRALLQMNKKNIFAAEEDFEKIIAISPENILAKSGLAMLTKRKGEWKEAEEMYTDLIYKNKTNADFYFNRAECYLHLNKLARTQEDLAKAAELGYENSSLYILRGQLKLAQYDKFQAKEDFLKAKEMGADEKVIEDFLRLCK